MGIETRIVDDIAIVELSSNRTPLGSDDQSVADTIRRLLDQGHRKIVIKLEGVTVIDSALLGEIAQAYITVSRAGGTLRLEGMNERLRDLFARTGLARLFESEHRPPDPSSPHLRDVSWSPLVAAGLLILVILVMMLWKMWPRL